MCIFAEIFRCKYLLRLLNFIELRIMNIDLATLWQISPWLCVLAVTVIVVIFMTRLFDRTKRHDVDITEIKSDVKNMSSKLDYLSGKLDNLSDSISWLQTGNVARKKSPMQLNEVGGDILEKSFLREAIDTNRDFLFEKIKEKNPQNEADIDSECFNVIFGLYSNPIFAQTRMFAYNNPTYGEVSLNPLTTSRIGAIYLRNLYINENKNV